LFFDVATELFLMLQNSKVSGVQGCKVTRKWVQKPSLFLCPFAATHCTNLDCPLYI